MNIVSTGLAVALALVVVAFFFLPGLFPFRASAPVAAVDSGTLLQAASTTDGTSGNPMSATGAAPAGALVSTADGLQMQDLIVGTGVAAKAGDSVTVNYIGKLADGTTFDASANHGSAGFTFPLGAGQVIKGWDEGVAGMKVGGTRVLVIPPI